MNNEVWNLKMKTEQNESHVILRPWGRLLSGKTTWLCWMADFITSTVLLLFSYISALSLFFCISALSLFFCISALSSSFMQSADQYSVQHPLLKDQSPPPPPPVVALPRPFPLRSSYQAAYHDHSFVTPEKEVSGLMAPPPPPPTPTLFFFFFFWLIDFCDKGRRDGVAWREAIAWVRKELMVGHGRVPPLSPSFSPLLPPPPPPIFSCVCVGVGGGGGGVEMSIFCSCVFVLYLLELVSVGLGLGCLCVLGGGGEREREREMSFFCSCVFVLCLLELVSVGLRLGCGR